MKRLAAAEAIIRARIEEAKLEIVAIAPARARCTSGTRAFSVIVRVSADDIDAQIAVDLDRDLETRKTIDLNPDAVVVDVPHEGAL